MTDKISILITAFVHIIMRTTIFLEQPQNDCSPAPNIASWIFLLSMLSLFSDKNFYPYDSRRSLRAFQILFESIMCILLSEVSIIIVWCSLERISYKLMKCILLQSSSNIYYDMGGDALVGILLIGFSGIIFMSILKLAGYDNNLKKKFKTLWKKINEQIQKFMSRVNENMPSSPPIVCRRPEQEVQADREDGWCFGNVSPPAQNTRKKSAMTKHRNDNRICRR